MSVNFKSSSVLIGIDKASYERIVNAMKSIKDHTEEYVLSRSVNQTLKEAQKQLVKRAKKRYVNTEWVKGIKGRSKIYKAYAKNPSGKISFKSEQPGIEKFKYYPSTTPTKLKRGSYPLFLDFRSRANPNGKAFIFPYGGRNKFNTGATQLRERGRKTQIQGAFVVTFKNHTKDKTALAIRKRDSRYPIQKILGTSDRSMIGNEHVYGEEEQNIASYLNEQCVIQLNRILSKGSK